MGKTALLLVGLICCLAKGSSADKSTVPPIGPLGDVPVPADNPQTQGKIALGKQLFFDPRLSGSQWISCNTCHNAGLGFTDGLSKGIGHGMKELGRKTPTLYNVGYGTLQFWDGRAKDLEEQAVGPIQADKEMNMPMEILLPRIAKIPGYVTQFDKEFGNNSVTKENLAKAIAAFERTLVSTDSRFDQYMKGKHSAMTASQIRGMTLYNGKARCIQCHNGTNFTDNAFHNIGIASAKGLQDEGRFKIVPVSANKGAFKTPTLRSVALVGPYMHNGSLATLADVVNFYDRGGDDRANLDPLIQPLHLSAKEKADLLAFLSALTGKSLDLTIPELPRS